MRLGLLALTLAGLAINSACLDRPVLAICSGGAGLSISKVRVQRIDKLDLLIVVDNSISMADKQSELGRRMPELIAALTDPTPDPKSGKPMHMPDIHVGVVTSSLGSHGTSACAVELTNQTNNDRGHLLPRAGDTTCPGTVAATPLAWAYGESSARLASATSCVVASAKEQGCGYEETWEAMYHFLVDPAPYAKAEVRCTFGVSGDACGSNKIELSGVDEELLAQRKAFLRPDSLLAVIVLSDENDASLKPAGLNWLPWGYGKGEMQRGWAGCDNVPDDFEPESAADFNRLHTEFNCWSCFEKGDDPSCKLPWASDPLNNDVDGKNLRAMRQTNRYGYNFLWGRQRYVDAFTKGQVFGSDGKLAPNPVFSGGFRTQDLIVVATIVGVPRKAVANADGTPKELTTADWDWIQGPVGKRDPQMFEQIAPRTQAGPDGATIPKFAGDRSVNYSAANGGNGGDRDISDGDDLQYACIEERSSPGANIDCQGTDAAMRNPLCATDGTQPFFKAYPGLRHLRIAKDLGISGFVASICAKSYAPAIKGITDKVKAALNSQCLRTSLTPNAAGSVSCLIVEALAEGADGGKRCEQLGKGLCTPGAAPCRRAGTAYPPVSADKAASQLNLPITVMRSDGSGVPQQTQATVENGNVYVIGDDKPNAKKHLVCELEQLTGPSLTACANDPAFTLDPTTTGGYCYSSVPEIVGEQCVKLGAPGTIRFFGAAEPRPGSEVFTFCSSGTCGG